ncbi:MAG TPA: DUF3348 family protein [Noviherbaspirillum sp.]|nr:DUF3348 family protein [Noviherbaspirillum sp.]
MTRVLPRTNFHSSKLIRCLIDLTLIETAETANAFAEKLGTWIHFADAIALSEVHNARPASAAKLPDAAKSRARMAAGSEFARIQTSLTDSINKSFSPKLGKTHIVLPVPQLELPLDVAVAYVPYRRFYEAHQRDMELRIQPLRTNVREALAQVSPQLRKFAELDALLEKILRERERQLLSTLPLLLKKHFVRLFTEHQQKLANRQLTDKQLTDKSAGWVEAGGWLARFCNDLQQLLLAELELRLQPTVGLIETFDIHNE